MTKMTVLIAPVAIALTACAAGTYVKPGVSQTEADSDLAQCQYQAQLATAPIHDTIMRGVRRGELTMSCMKLRGYSVEGRGELTRALLY